MYIQVSRIGLSRDKRIIRKWAENEDGTFTWRNRADSVWLVEKLNEPEPRRKPIYSTQGWPFRIEHHQVTLDDFVFLYDRKLYVHIATGSHFTARHINKLIFRDKATWPTRLMQGRMKPTSFIRRYNRVTQSAEYNEVMEVLHAAAA